MRPISACGFALLGSNLPHTNAIFGAWIQPHMASQSRTPFTNATSHTRHSYLSKIQGDASHPLGVKSTERAHATLQEQAPAIACTQTCTIRTQAMAEIVLREAKGHYEQANVGVVLSVLCLSFSCVVCVMLSLTHMRMNSSSFMWVSLSGSWRCIMACTTGGSRLKPGAVWGEVWVCLLCVHA